MVHQLRVTAQFGPEAALAGAMNLPFKLYQCALPHAQAVQESQGAALDSKTLKRVSRRNNAKASISNAWAIPYVRSLFLNHLLIFSSPGVAYNYKISILRGTPIYLLEYKAFLKHKLNIFLLVCFTLFHRLKIKQRRHELKQTMFCLTFEQEQVKRARAILLSPGLVGWQYPSHASLAPRCQRANSRGWVLAMSMEIVIHFIDCAVWKRRLQNTCELNEPCRRLGMI